MNDRRRRLFDPPASHGPHAPGAADWIEEEPVEVSAGFHFELLWTTALHPDFTALNSVTIPFTDRLSATIPAEKIMMWNKSGSPLTQLRIDLGARPNEVVRVKRILLRGE